MTASAIVWLRDGDWLTLSRLRIYSLTLIGFYVAIIGFVLATAHGALDLSGKPVGTDFSQTWLAGRAVLAGHPSVPFDQFHHEVPEQVLFGPTQPLDFWHYPPYFLFVAAAAALMPYLTALAAWQLGTLACYAATIRAILPGRLPLACALAFPAVYVNLGHGQNGFLTAALMGAAVVCLPRREWLAGMLFGLCAYKPQFGLAVPLALLAGWHWRAIASAAATVAAMTLASIAAFGTGPWLAFRAGMGFTRIVVLESGAAGWEKLQSVFAAARMWGAGTGAAWAIQALASLMVLALIVRLWRSNCDVGLKGAALLAGALLTTPYCLDYDMVLLGPAAALMVSYARTHGFAPWQKSGLVFVFLAPMLARAVAAAAFLPLGLASIACMFSLVVWAGRHDGGRKA